MNKAEQYGRKTIILAYVLGLLGMLGIVMAIKITGNQAGEIKHSSEYIDITDQWSLDENGVIHFHLRCSERHGMRDHPGR